MSGSHERPAVVGVDACRRGWVAVFLAPGRAPHGRVVETLADLEPSLAEVATVGIDIPIGLPRRGRRHADLEARRLLGPRRHSVFVTPPRAALTAPTHREASARSRELTGHGMSQQAYALRRKVLEAEQWVPRAPVAAFEVHPEVTFALLLGHPARAPKRTWAGMREREAALAAAGIELDALGPAGEHAAVDDVLDAAAAAWSAGRLARGEAIALPDPPDRDPDTGRAVAIWA